MKKEIKRRKDSKMTAKVTEDRQYRYFDHYLTDDLANRLLLVDVETKELKDLTPEYDRLLHEQRRVRLRHRPRRQERRHQPQLHAAALSRVSSTTTSTWCPPTARAS